MRDAHRLKEKYDLQLDSRQVGALLIGGVVVTGAVFVLGVMVGKKLAGDEQAVNAPDLLTAIDRKSELVQQTQELAESGRDASLTFPDELTKKAPPLPPPDPPSKLTEASPAPAPLPELPVMPTLPRAAEAPKPAAAEAVPVRTSGKEGLRDAIARAQQPSEAAENGGFTLQISASQDRAEADRFVSRLRDKGYAPYILEAQVPGKGTWFRVRMGSFATKEAATRYLQDFRRETQLEAFVAMNEQGTERR